MPVFCNVILNNRDERGHCGNASCFQRRKLIKGLEPPKAPTKVGIKALPITLTYRGNMRKIKDKKCGLFQ